jgi:predicted DNA-binding transcriptional regulator AlpA
MNKNEKTVAEKLAEIVTSIHDDKRIFGIRGLSEYLKCSYPTARKIAASGAFPRYQAKGSRMIFFKESEILQGIAK